MGQLGVRPAARRIGGQDDQARVAEAPEHVPLRVGDLGPQDPPAGDELGASGRAAHQAQQYPVQDVPRGAGQPGGGFLGEPVQRAPDTAHLVVTGEGDGLAALPVPQLGQGELEQRQRPVRRVLDDLVDEPGLEPYSARGRRALYGLSHLHRGERRQQVQPLVEPGVEARDFLQDRLEVGPQRQHQPGRVVGRLGRRDQQVEQVRVGRLIGRQQLLELVDDEEQRAVLAAQQPGRPGQPFLPEAVGLAPDVVGWHGDAVVPLGPQQALGEPEPGILSRLDDGHRPPPLAAQPGHQPAPDQGGLAHSRRPHDDHHRPFQDPLAELRDLGVAAEEHGGVPGRERLEPRGMASAVPAGNRTALPMPGRSPSAAGDRRPVRQQPDRPAGPGVPDRRAAVAGLGLDALPAPALHLHKLAADLAFEVEVHPHAGVPGRDARVSEHPHDRAGPGCHGRQQGGARGVRRVLGKQQAGHVPFPGTGASRRRRGPADHSGRADGAPRHQAELQLNQLGAVRLPLLVLAPAEGGVDDVRAGHHVTGPDQQSEARGRPSRRPASQPDDRPFVVVRCRVPGALSGQDLSQVIVIFRLNLGAVVPRRAGSARRT